MGKRAWYDTHMSRMAERLWSLSDEEVHTAVPASVASTEDIPEYVIVEDLSTHGLPNGVSATTPKNFIIKEADTRTQPMRYDVLLVLKLAFENRFVV